MDYTQIPRALIYKDRTDLNDFGVQESGTMNNFLFTQMGRLTLLRCGNAKEIVLQCLNNAYYICTLIQLDEFPHLCMDNYEKKLLEVNIPFPKDVYQASMALVCVLLAAYDDKYKQNDNLLIENIHDWTSSNKWTGSLCHKSFKDILKTCSTDRFTLSKSEFAPRDIVEVIENCSVEDLQVYADYICERLALLKDQSLRIYGTDMAIARIKDYQRELCEDSEYNPKKDTFKYADNDPYLRDFKYEDSVRMHYQQSKEAIGYYTEHYPTKEENDSYEGMVDSAQVPETKVLQKEREKLESKPTLQVGELQQQLIEKNQALQEALQIIKEYEKPVMELTAKQKIRMEFALQLLQNSGLTELNLNKDKTATLLSALLDIGHQNCYNYLIHRNYHPQIQDEKTILTIDEFCAEMGIRAFLSLKTQ